MELPAGLSGLGSVLGPSSESPSPPSSLPTGDGVAGFAGAAEAGVVGCAGCSLGEGAGVGLLGAGVLSPPPLLPPICTFPLPEPVWWRSVLGVLLLASFANARCGCSRTVAMTGNKHNFDR